MAFSLFASSSAILIK